MLPLLRTLSRPSNRFRFNRVVPIELVQIDGQLHTYLTNGSISRVLFLHYANCPTQLSRWDDAVLLWAVVKREKAEMIPHPKSSAGFGE